MNRKHEYRLYLKSDHWKQLKTQKFASVPVVKCERCGSEDDIQVHHKFYRDSWFDARISDLEILCAGCHVMHHKREKEHRKNKKHHQKRKYNRKFDRVRFDKEDNYISYNKGRNLNKSHLSQMELQALWIDIRIITDLFILLVKNKQFSLITFNLSDIAIKCAEFYQRSSSKMIKKILKQGKRDALEHRKRIQSRKKHEISF